MLPDPYPVTPWTRPCRGSVRVPGSKSLTNRSLVIAALSHGVCRLEGALFSRDTRILCQSLDALGFAVTPDPASASIQVVGQGGVIPAAEASLHVGNAGTAARFLTALVCCRPGGRYFFDGDPEMRLRPMGGLIKALERLGARFSFHGESGRFPFTVETSGLPGGDWSVDAAASSQMLSALMMVAPAAAGDVRIRSSGARPAFVEMTAGLMRQFGAAIDGSPEGGYRIGATAYAPPEGGRFDIEPDATAASYFLALPLAVGGGVLVEGLRQNMLQGDIAFARILENYGLVLDWTPLGLQVNARCTRPPVHADWDFETFSDTFLTLAALSPLLQACVRIRGIAHTRHQETDRIHAVTTELRKCGVPVDEEPGALTIHPPRGPLAAGSVIHTYHDHRVAMAFAILGCHPLDEAGRPWLHIADPACCSKTFPEFFSVLDQLYRFSHDK